MQWIAGEIYTPYQSDRRLNHGASADITKQRSRKSGLNKSKGQGGPVHCNTAGQPGCSENSSNHQGRHRNDFATSFTEVGT